MESSTINAQALVGKFNDCPWIKQRTVSLFYARAMDKWSLR
jgi:hypothetical protein